MEGHEEENKETLIDGKKEIEIEKIYCLAKVLIMHGHQKTEIGEFVRIIEELDKKEEEFRRRNAALFSFVKVLFGIR